MNTREMAEFFENEVKKMDEDTSIKEDFVLGKRIVFEGKRYEMEIFYRDGKVTKCNINDKSEHGSTVNEPIVDKKDLSDTHNTREGLETYEAYLIRLADHYDIKLNIDELKTLIAKTVKNESLINEDKRQNLLDKIAKEIYAKIDKIYDHDPDLMEYVFVEPYIKKGHYDDGSDLCGIEVRAEQTYEGMMNLADDLDPIVQKYDKKAYFDMVTGGIMHAAIDMDNLNESLVNEEVEDENDELALALQDYIMNTSSDWSDERNSLDFLYVHKLSKNLYGTKMGGTVSEEYLVFSSYDEAVAAAEESERELLDDIGISGINWQYMPYSIEHYINEDWFRQAWEEMNQYYIEDIIYEGGGRFHDELVERGIDPAKYGYNEETDEFEDEEGAKEAFADSMMADIEDDLIGEYKFQLGEENFEYAIKEAGADLDEIAADIVETDGPANALAGYDGKEVEWKYEGNTYYMYRTN